MTLPIAPGSRRTSLVRRLLAVLAVMVGAASVLIGGAAPAMAGGTVDNYLICVWNNDDGSYTSVWGYNNTTGDTVTEPVGSNNRITSAPYDRGQPTVFEPGQHDNAWVYTTFDKSVTWHLYNNTASANNGSPRCASNPVPVVGGWGSGVAALLVAALGALVITRTPRLRALFAVPRLGRRSAG